MRVPRVKNELDAEAYRMGCQFARESAEKLSNYGAQAISGKDCYFIAKATARIVYGKESYARETAQFNQYFPAAAQVQPTSKDAE